MSQVMKGTTARLIINLKKSHGSLEIFRVKVLKIKGTRRGDIEGLSIAAQEVLMPRLVAHVAWVRIPVTYFRDAQLLRCETALDETYLFVNPPSVLA